MLKDIIINLPMDNIIIELTNSQLNALVETPFPVAIAEDSREELEGKGFNFELTPIAPVTTYSELKDFLRARIAVLVERTKNLQRERCYDFDQLNSDKDLNQFPAVVLLPLSEEVFIEVDGIGGTVESLLKALLQMGPSLGVHTVVFKKPEFELPEGIKLLLNKTAQHSRP